MGSARCAGTLTQDAADYPDFDIGKQKNFSAGASKTAFIRKTYAHVPMPHGGPEASYELVNQIRYDTLQACEADLPSAGQRHVRRQLWYDQRHPWMARWSLEEASAAPIAGFTAACAGITLWLDLAAARRRRRSG